MIRSTVQYRPMYCVHVLYTVSKIRCATAAKCRQLEVPSTQPVVVHVKTGDGRTVHGTAIGAGYDTDTASHAVVVAGTCAASFVAGIALDDWSMRYVALALMMLELRDQCTYGKGVRKQAPAASARVMVACARHYHVPARSAFTCHQATPRHESRGAPCSLTCRLVRAGGRSPRGNFGGANSQTPHEVAPTR